MATDRRNCDTNNLHPSTLAAGPEAIRGDTKVEPCQGESKRSRENSRDYAIEVPSFSLVTPLMRPVKSSTRDPFSNETW